MSTDWTLVVSHDDNRLIACRFLIKGISASTILIAVDAASVWPLDG